MSLIIGLTGGIGSGKSTVADLFAAFGAAVVDTDAIAHELTGAHGTAIPDIVAVFGKAVVRDDGALDRDAMRRLVFADPDARRRLEAILHPLIRRTGVARARAAGEDGAVPYVLLVVPLLVESAAYVGEIDRVLLVDCDEALQRQRVMVRSGLSCAEVQMIIASQASRSERLAIADDVLVNNDGRDALQTQVAALHRRYLELAGAYARAGKVNANC